MKNQMPNPMTDQQNLDYTRDLLADQAARFLADQAQDPQPQMNVIYIPPNTIKNHAQLTDPKNWRTDIIIFGSLDDSRFDLMQKLGTEYGKKATTLLAVYFCTVVWGAAYAVDPKTGNRLPNAPMPSEHPDRDELLLAWGCTLTQQRCCLYHKIQRNSNGTLTLGAEQQNTGTQTTLLTRFFDGYAPAFLARVTGPPPRPQSKPTHRKVNLN